MVSMISQSLKTKTIAQAPIPQQDLDRKHRMQDAWAAYRGQFTPPLKIKRDQPNDNVQANCCGPIVNHGVWFLFGQVLKIEATDEASESGSVLQDFINGLWGNDDAKMTRLSNMALNGGVCGQCFVKLIEPQGGMKYPRIVVLDPMLVRMVTDPDDCELVIAFIIEYPSTTNLEKRQIIARVDPDGMDAINGGCDLDDTWTIYNYTRNTTSSSEGGWSQVGESIEWPYPFAPILTCQNLPNPNESWGTTDLTQSLINQNKVLQFIESNTARVIKFHGHPKTWAKGIRASQINIGVDETIVLEDPNATLQNLEMHSDLSAALKFASVIRDNIDEESCVPAVALGRQEMIPKGNVSGVALQLLFQPLINKTITKQRLYGEFIREITRSAMVLSGALPVEQYEDYKINLNWMTLLPIDDLVAVQEAIGLKSLGVSTLTLLQKLGFDPEDEAKKSALEAPKMPPTQQQPVPSPEQQQPQEGEIR